MMPVLDGLEGIEGKGIITDQSTSFMSRLMKSLYSQLGVKGLEPLYIIQKPIVLLNSSH